MEKNELLKRITINPETCHGKPCIRDLRYPVSSILEYLAGGDTVQDILAEFTDLEEQDILASRIESFSVSGAVLISETVFEQIQNQAHLSAVSLGAFSFKNVKKLTEVYALTNDGLVVPNPDELEGKGQRVEPPKHNLPQQLTSFIGREQEIAEISTLVQKEKLLTLTGPGGTGKTRLALKVAESLVGDFKDGVFWIPLASISDLDSVKLAMIKTLGLIQLPAVNSVDLLINFLQKKNCCWFLTILSI